MHALYETAKSYAPKFVQIAQARPSGIDNGVHVRDVDGGNWRNKDGDLTRWGANGKALKYREWDLFKPAGPKLRGQLRILTSEDDNSAWLTLNHYRTFINLRPGKGVSYYLKLAGKWSGFNGYDEEFVDPLIETPGFDGVGDDPIVDP